VSLAVSSGSPSAKSRAGELRSTGHPYDSILQGALAPDAFRFSGRLHLVLHSGKRSSSLEFVPWVLRTIPRSSMR
jgi:hypothetical protein